MMNGKKTILGAASMLAVFLLGQAGVETTETEVMGWIAAGLTLLGLVHKLTKAIIKWDFKRSEV